MKTELDEILKKIHNCVKKVKYRTHLDADLACAELWALKNRDLKRYRCDCCFNWHLTHGPWDPDYHATKIDKVA